MLEYYLKEANMCEKNSKGKRVKTTIRHHVYLGHLNVFLDQNIKYKYKPKILNLICILASISLISA